MQAVCTNANTVVAVIETKRGSPFTTITVLAETTVAVTSGRLIPSDLKPIKGSTRFSSATMVAGVLPVARTIVFVVVRSAGSLYVRRVPGRLAVVTVAV